MRIAKSGWVDIDITRTLLGTQELLRQSVQATKLAVEMVSPQRGQLVLSGGQGFVGYVKRWVTTHVIVWNAIEFHGIGQGLRQVTLHPIQVKGVRVNTIIWMIIPPRIHSTLQILCNRIIRMSTYECMGTIILIREKKYT